MADNRYYVSQSGSLLVLRGDRPNEANYQPDKRYTQISAEQYEQTYMKGQREAEAIGRKRHEAAIQQREQKKLGKQYEQIKARAKAEGIKEKDITILDPETYKKFKSKTETYRNTPNMQPTVVDGKIYWKKKDATKALVSKIMQPRIEAAQAKDIIRQKKARAEFESTLLKELDTRKAAGEKPRVSVSSKGVTVMSSIAPGESLYTPEEKAKLLASYEKYSAEGKTTATLVKPKTLQKDKPTWQQKIIPTQKVFSDYAGFRQEWFETAGEKSFSKLTPLVYKPVVMGGFKIIQKIQTKQQRQQILRDNPMLEGVAKEGYNYYYKTPVFAVGTAALGFGTSGAAVKLASLGRGSKAATVAVGSIATGIYGGTRGAQYIKAETPMEKGEVLGRTIPEVFMFGAGAYAGGQFFGAKGGAGGTGKAKTGTKTSSQLGKQPKFSKGGQRYINPKPFKKGYVKVTDTMTGKKVKMNFKDYLKATDTSYKGYTGTFQKTSLASGLLRSAAFQKVSRVFPKRMFESKSGTARFNTRFNTEFNAEYTSGAQRSGSLVKSSSSNIETYKPTMIGFPRGFSITVAPSRSMTTTSWMSKPSTGLMSAPSRGIQLKQSSLAKNIKYAITTKKAAAIVNRKSNIIPSRKTGGLAMSKPTALMTTKPSNIITQPSRPIQIKPRNDIVSRKPQDITPRKPQEITKGRSSKPIKPKPDAIGKGGGFEIPPLPLPGLPKLPGGGGGSFSFPSRGRYARQKKIYTPSLIATTFGIYGSKPKGALSGLGIRPIVGKKKNDRKRKTRTGNIFARINYFKFM